MHDVSGTVEIIPQKSGCHYVRMPGWITDELSFFADRGLIPDRATLGVSTWDTSLLPMADGSHFIALNARVRRENSEVDVGDEVSISFVLRER